MNGESSANGGGMKLHPIQLAARREAETKFRRAAGWLAQYVIEHATFTVEPEPELGIDDGFQQCGECDATAPIPGALVHDAGCVVLAAHRVQEEISKCPTCQGVGSVRVETEGCGSMGKVRCCADWWRHGRAPLSDPMRDERTMRVLIACECSGAVRRAFRVRGHDAWSCDLQPAEDGSEHHLVGDARDFLADGWDLMVAHPPCTYLSRAGARWWKDPERQAKADAAAEFVLTLWNAPIEKIAIENPIGQLNRRWRYPDQTIQPWHFGHPYTKATCLWLKNLPPLMSTLICAERIPFLPSNTGWNRRKGQRSSPGVVSGGQDASRTFQGVAEAMAEQWGGWAQQKAA